MKPDDPRQRVYLEPIVRMVKSDVEFILSGDMPYTQLAHRLTVLLKLVDGAIQRCDEVDRQERKSNEEGFAAALIRKDAAIQRINSALMDRVVNQRMNVADDILLHSFLSVQPGVPQYKEGATIDKVEKPSYHARIKDWWDPLTKGPSDKE